MKVSLVLCALFTVAIAIELVALRALRLRTAVAEYRSPWQQT